MHSPIFARSNRMAAHAGVVLCAPGGGHSRAPSATQVRGGGGRKARTGFEVVCSQM